MFSRSESQIRAEPIMGLQLGATERNNDGIIANEDVTLARILRILEVNAMLRAVALFTEDLHKMVCRAVGELRKPGERERVD